MSSAKKRPFCLGVSVLTLKTGPGVHLGRKSWKMAYDRLDIYQMKPDIKHLHKTSLIIQVSQNMLSRWNVHIMLCKIDSCKQPSL